MSAVAKAPDALSATYWDRHNQLHRDFLQAVIADPAAFADVPRDAVLFLIPHDADEAFLTANIEAGRDMLQKGRSVYLRRLAPGELPAVERTEATGSWDDNVVQRERFEPPLDDGAERPEEPTR